MNPIRNAVPNVLPTASRRATRLATAAMFFTVMLGAISCSDDNGTAPLAPVNPGHIEDVASDESKREATEDPGPAPSASISSAAASASSAAAAAAPGYTLSSIPFAAEAGPFSNPLPGTDDHTYGSNSADPNGPGPHPGLDIGFSFMFYGQSYTKFFLGSNGVILFSHVPKGACCSAFIPLDDAATSTMPPHRNNLIALAWTDLKPLPSQITYTVRGTAPRRRLIVNFDQVPFFTQNGIPHTARVTTQAILYEGTNVIEVHTRSQASASFNVTQGVENANGSVATPTPGRNRARYALTNDAVRFTPLGQNAVPVALPGGNAGSPIDHYAAVEGAVINFKGSGSDADGDPLTYSWDFDNDANPDATGPEATWSYPDNRTHTATLTVNDGRGGIGRASVNVIVSNAVPVVNAGSDVHISAGETVNFAGRFSDAGVSDSPWGWTWNYGAEGYSFDNTDSQVAEILGSHRFCKAGKFPVKLTVTDKDGAAGSDELEVAVDALPVSIDVNPNTINLNGNGHGMITVRIFSRQGLDATALNPNSIRLRGAGGRGTQLARTGGGLWHWNADADLNGDGLLDVAAGFRRDELVKNNDLTLNSTEVSLGGEVGDCGEVLGAAAVRVKVQSKDKSAASTLQPTGEAATPIDPSNP